MLPFVKQQQQKNKAIHFEINQFDGIHNNFVK